MLVCSISYKDGSPTFHPSSTRSRGREREREGDEGEGGGGEGREEERDDMIKVWTVWMEGCMHVHLRADVHVDECCVTLLLGRCEQMSTHTR